MFGIGPMELVVIAIVAVVLVGPDKLPDIMRKFGRIFVQVRRQANEVKSTFNDAMHDAEREFELDRIRELQRRLQSASPNQVIEAAFADPPAAKLHREAGFDSHGHPLPGHDDHGHPSTSPASHDYHDSHYHEGQFVKPDTFVEFQPDPPPAQHLSSQAPTPALDAPAPPAVHPDKTPAPSDIKKS